MNHPSLTTSSLAWYCYVPAMLLVVAGVYQQHLTEYYPAVDPAQFFVYDGALLAMSPVTLLIVLGPAFNRVDPSIQRTIRNLVTRYPSLTKVEARIHDSIWSERLVNRFPVLPASIRTAMISVSDFRTEGVELFRAQFHASAGAFTTSFSAALPGLNIAMEGFNKDLPFMLTLHRALSTVTFAGGCKIYLRLDRAHSMTLKISGRMSDGEKFLKTLAKVINQPQFITQTYIVQLLSINVQMLHQLNEFSSFLRRLVLTASNVNDLAIQVVELNPNEANQWMDGVRRLGSFRKLVRVVIAHPLPLPLLDADVARLLVSWPNAEYISLNSRPSLQAITLGQPTNFLTRNVLEGVANYAPQSLRHLGLFLVANEVSVFSFGTHQPRASVARLELGIAGSASDGHIRQVIMMARELFPNAEVVRF